MHHAQAADNSFFQHIRQGVRPNGRSLLGARSVTTDAGGTASTADGAALIRLASTAVLATVQCEPMLPIPDGLAPRGRIVVSIDMPSICSPAVGQATSATAAAGAAGRWTGERDMANLAELLQCTASKQLVDLFSLSVVEGHSVWSCHCDIVVLEDDGNLRDAAFLAMMAALSRVRLPRCELDDESGALNVIEEHAQAMRLTLPLYPCTFAVVEGAALLDPCAEEEMHASTCFTLMLDAAGALRALHKSGGAPLPGSLLPECLRVAQGRVPMLVTLVAITSAGGNAV